MIRYVKRHLPLVLLQCGHWRQPEHEIDRELPFRCDPCGKAVHAARDEMDDTPVIITMWETTQ